jgi:outer membrane protein OmpA-like peptidoglycan-associated protein
MPRLSRPGRVHTTISGGSRRAAFIVLVAVVVAAASPARAAPAISPTATLRDFFNRAVAVIDDARRQMRPADGRERIRALTHTMFDARAAAPLILGRDWEARSAAEREEFADLFGRLMEQAYVAWIKALLGSATLEVRYLDESVRDTQAMVKTTVRAKDGRDVPIDYRMAMDRGRWSIRDVVVDGVSLIDNYRAQLQHLLVTMPYSEVVAAMRSKATVTASASPPTESASRSALDAITFEPGADTLTPAAERVLDANAEWLRRNPGVRVEVEGHTDERGDPATNAALGLRRAEAATQALVTRGIERDRMRVTSYAATRPACVERDDACRALNRRVQFSADE